MSQGRSRRGEDADRIRLGAAATGAGGAVYVRQAQLVRVWRAQAHAIVPRSPRSSARTLSVEESPRVLILFGPAQPASPTDQRSESLDSLRSLMTTRRGAPLSS